MAEQKLRIPLSSLGRKLVQDLPYSRPVTPGQHTQVQIGWIGLGAMGYLMARNLANHRATHLEQQPPLLVWNRSKDKSEKLLHELGERKVAIAQSVVDVATRCDIVLFSLSSDDVIRSVYKEFAATLQARRLTPIHPQLLTSFFFFKMNRRRNPRRSAEYSWKRARSVSRHRRLCGFHATGRLSLTHTRENFRRYIPAWQACSISLV